mmetsp:Transcript_21443/g.52471  ORF Transcript_21443/g.52471 Transcript_21443/m.52471 type:complete len:94 (+) Transcript_21443:224-505(+)
MLQDYDYVFRHRPLTSDEEAYQLGAVGSQSVDANINAVELRSMPVSQLFYLDEIKKAQDQCAEVSRVKAYIMGLYRSCRDAKSMVQSCSCPRH